MKARRYLISGRVQGVGFRYFTWQQATKLGVSGWVRNLPTGEVELHAEGDGDALFELEKRIEAGPSFGFVSQVDRQPSELRGYDSFEIRG